MTTELFAEGADLVRAPVAHSKILKYVLVNALVLSLRVREDCVDGLFFVEELFEMKGAGVEQSHRVASWAKVADKSEKSSYAINRLCRRGT
jgi:hypothetical protein